MRLCRKQASKRKRVTKAAVPALGAAGLTFSLAGGASASALPTADTPQKLNFSPTSPCCSAKKKSPTSVSPRSICSTRSMAALPASSRWPGAAVAAVAAVAVVAAAAVDAVVAAAAVAARLLRVVGLLPPLLRRGIFRLRDRIEDLLAGLDHRPRPIHVCCAAAGPIALAGTSMFPTKSKNASARPMDCRPGTSPAPAFRHRQTKSAVPPR